MFHSLFSFALFALAASSVVTSSPIMRRRYGETAPITPRTLVPVTLGGVQIGLNDQGGSLDDFFGVGNFAGNLNQVTIIEQQQQLVCRSVDLVRVRQQLAVIQEFAKQIILQQVCEVEIQTVIIQQLNSQFVNFGRNVRRVNGGGITPSFDIVIAQKITEITQVISRGGSLADLNLGFLGSDIGRNSVRIGGSNWNDASSPRSVGDAYKAAKDQQKKEKDMQDASKSTSATSTSTTDSPAASATSASLTETTTTSSVTSTAESVSNSAPAPSPTPK
ncbi:hypothetical protein RSOLAG1IB_01501 [Rhizoctonia solani AG-1 IB]|uniref:Uncharacterized protein n=1 Tax=Thanatephorus cucumeris (strain AG1-IB / isolate 7/3/14) TaxID=1108050 RepID=A0A0B7FF03_THACB|nr:hypothetical protein RSOLAG1IB_01501 [Rhizoctonia solani AG-1 IB]